MKRQAREQTRVLEVRGLRFTAWHGAPRTMNLPHSHPDVEANLLVAGRVTYLFNGCIHSLQSGKLALFWGGLPHLLCESSSDAQMFWLTVPLTDYLQMDLPLSCTQALLSGSLLYETNEADTMPIDLFQFRRWVKELPTGGPNADLSRREVTLRLHRFALGWKPDTPQHMPARGAIQQAARVFEVLSRHSTEIGSVQDISDRVGLHPKYLIQTFKRTYGIGAWEYLMRLRIGQAQRLLCTTDLPVLDVAQETGYRTLSAFYRAFRRYTNGITPAAYRRAVQTVLSQPTVKPTAHRSIGGTPLNQGSR